ncbi:MAG: hypothetical protein DSZ05_08835 [Sulfurospirillum sp.]|nr:MAG: hypothetical protein DSZ05_08835 [Sulfurospirillum sp.]
MKKILFSSLAVFALQTVSSAEVTNFDLSLKTGLTALRNDSGSDFNKGTFAIDGTADLGYYINPRIDMTYVNVDENPGTVKSLWQLALAGQYEAELSDQYYVDPYAFAGMGFEYVNGSRRGFEHQIYAEAGAGLKIPVSDSFNVVTEYRAIHIFDKSRNDEKNEFALLIGLSMPFHIEKSVPVEKVVPDQDYDGVLNQNDLCPDTPPGVKVDSDGCPIPPKEIVVEKVVRAVPKKIVVLDSDHDGVLDCDDKCPNTPKGFVVNKAGCGIKKRLEVHFKSDSANLAAGSVQEIRKFAQYLERMPHVTVTIEGYTDSSGYFKKNMVLSRQRANAVRKALISLGVSPRRIKAVGKGPLNPIANNETKEGRALNRRIEAVIHQ